MFTSIWTLPSNLVILDTEQAIERLSVMSIKEIGGRSNKLSNRAKSFLACATKIARLNGNHWKHGAILVHSGRVIAAAPNIYKNDPELFQRLYPHDSEEQRVSIKKHCSEHAEARVVRMAGEKARGSIVYVSRVNRTGQEMMSRPCDDCYTLMVEAGVKSVVYTESAEYPQHTYTRRSDNYARERASSVKH